jgi:hypothetical protein
MRASSAGSHAAGEREGSPPAAAAAAAAEAAQTDNVLKRRRLIMARAITRSVLEAMIQLRSRSVLEAHNG